MQMFHLHIQQWTLQQRLKHQVSQCERQTQPTATSYTLNNFPTIFHTLVKRTASARLLVALLHSSCMLTINTFWLWTWPWKAFTSLRARTAVSWGTMVWKPVAVSRAVHILFWTRYIAAIYI